MPVVYDYTFTGISPGTAGSGVQLNVALPEWVPAPENVIVSFPNSATRSVIWNDRLYRPTGQANQDPRDEILTLPILRTSPDNYEIGLEFGVIGTNFVANHVAILARQRNDTAMMFRYRRDVGYQLCTVAGNGVTVLGTAAQDVNPTGVSNTNNLRRRLRLRCDGSAYNCFVDTYDNTTNVFTANNTAVITVTNTSRPSGAVGLILASASANFQGATNGMYISRYYVDALGATAISFDNTNFLRTSKNIAYIAENVALSRLGRIVPII